MSPLYHLDGYCVNFEYYLNGYLSSFNANSKRYNTLFDEIIKNWIQMQMEDFFFHDLYTNKIKEVEKQILKQFME